MKRRKINRRQPQMRVTETRIFGGLANLFFLPSIGIFMLLRFVRVSREQAREAAEPESARWMRLVPPSLPAVLCCRSHW